MRSGDPRLETMANFVSQKVFTIEWGYCDPAGIVFNSRFFEFFDEGTWLLFETVLNVPRSELFSTYDLMGIPLVDARARFLVPVKFGETAEMTSQVAEFRRSSFDIEHRLTIRGELAVEGRETRVWATQDKDDPTRIKSKPIPAEVIERFNAG
jgi:4-hydroxybenzoyl-CoA thioesterase